MGLFESGLEKNLIKFDPEKRFITYIHQNKKRSWTYPEEKVQAETFLRLVLTYRYPVERIKMYVTVTMGSSSKEADILVYKDDACSFPYMVIECKKEEVSEQEYMQAVEQAFAYAYATPGDIKFVWITSGIRNLYFAFDKNSVKKNIIPDIPAFGVSKLAKYKYVLGGGSHDQEGDATEGKQKYFDLEVFTEEEITRRFKQAHNSLWAGGEMNPSQAFDELDKLIFCKI